MTGKQNRLAEELTGTAAKFPDRTALCIGSEQYTYAQLFGLAYQVSEQISRNGQTRVVAVHCSHTIHTYACLLGIMLAGRCYFPLSVQLPAARKSQLLERCKPDVILSPEDIHFSADVASASTFEVPELIQTNAYILFTSGTTGQPKGVPVTFSNLDAFLVHFDAHFDFNEHDRFLQPFDLGFDMALFSLLLAWRVGASVCVVTGGALRPLDMLAAIRDQVVTVAPLVPTILSYADRYLDELELRSLRYTFFAGDRLISAQAARWQLAAPQCRIYNMYGPTEATIVCTSHLFLPQKDRQGDVPIGRVFGGTWFVMLDEKGAVAEDAGELCLAGEQVITGYINADDSDRFIRLEGSRFYRTGDKVILNEAGELEFAGRIDRQLKIRGHRVEPAEIERVLTSLSGCRVAVVCVTDRSAQALVAFMEGRTDVALVLEQVRRQLPFYMIPSRLIQVDRLPLGRNDKVDQRALLALYDEHYRN